MRAIRRRFFSAGAGSNGLTRPACRFGMFCCRAVQRDWYRLAPGEALLLYTDGLVEAGKFGRGTIRHRAIVHAGRVDERAATGDCRRLRA